MEGVRVQVGGRASGFAVDLIWKKKERNGGNISFLTNIAPGAQDQLHSLLEPIENEMHDPLFNRSVEFQEG